MSDPGSSDTTPTGKRRPSRRAVIGGVAGIAGLTAIGVPTVLYLARRSGKLVTPLLASSPFYIAHRGGSANWPEMSLYAYRNAVDRRVDALEVSLARTSDGVWFGLHDRTLDRTSGTTDFVAAEHSWAEVQEHSITAAGTDDPNQAAQPYMRFEALIEAHGTTHTIFVDPKWTSPEHYPELLDIMDASLENPAETFIAKFYCTGDKWAAAARDRGFTTWGYYYAAEIEADTALLPSTQQRWDILGMDYDGSSSAWEDAAAYDKPIIGHIVPSDAAAATAISKGATGLMVSGVVEVVG